VANAIYGGDDELLVPVIDEDRVEPDIRPGSVSRFESNESGASSLNA
jgi:hypothetical protein